VVDFGWRWPPLPLSVAGWSAALDPVTAGSIAQVDADGAY
jgi:hypothetical protein